MLLNATLQIGNIFITTEMHKSINNRFISYPKRITEIHGNWNRGLGKYLDYRQM